MKNILSSIGELALVALIGLLIGFHFGGLNAQKEMSDLKASIASGNAKAEKAAALAQQIADAEQINALRTALSDNKAALDQQRLATIRLQQHVSSLNKRIMENEHTPTVKSWADTKIATGALDGLCFVSDEGVASPSCNESDTDASFTGAVSAGVFDGMCYIAAGGSPTAPRDSDALQLFAIAGRGPSRLQSAAWDTSGQWRFACTRSGSDGGHHRVQQANGTGTGEKWGGNSS